MEYGIECYNYHNYVHIAQNCRSGYSTNHFQGQQFQLFETRQNREVPNKKKPVV